MASLTFQRSPIARQILHMDMRDDFDRSLLRAYESWRVEYSIAEEGHGNMKPARDLTQPRHHLTSSGMYEDEGQGPRQRIGIRGPQ